ncbi:efflux RND transporter periplasmic adaptor subunit [Actinoallomurus rhizosphaericola]|uniref:efflux RND transporter periplasmic adaptor subunit n=1 Tax=Actinoallomurus rhizosphaericola TaxID=2952536 RepID=UPI0020900D3E|nr:efflux RND transporter periplasmic adaptor subunit [Actinoallomurus rhizosphaericola]MCO5994380.1 efflux RND transporter periplasmic adaptor subunit [Actinoallomurus rhizosphaericola]
MATGAIGVAVIGAVTAVAVGTGGGSGAAPTYATVAEGAVTATAGAAGNVRSADSRDLAFSTSGTVTKVYVKVGAKVRAGARLARVDQTRALEDVAAARATLAAAEAAESSGTGATGANAAAAAAGRATISLAAYRTTSPSPTPSASPSATKRPSTRPSTPRQTPTSRAPASSRSSGGGTSGGTTSAAQLEARVIQAKNTLTQAERTLAGTVITAPIDGTVLAVNGRAGDTASASSTFITIGDLEELQLQATFSQNDVARIRIGQEAEITLSTDSTKTYAGSVTHVDTNATTSDQLVKYGVMIAFDDVPSTVLIGQSGTVSVTTASATDVLYVPSSAVRTAANGTSTVRVRQGGRTVTRTVKVGVRGDACVEITSGLSKGERVVTSG